MLARLAELDVLLVDTIVYETGGRGLAVVCRAIGIDKPGFVSLFLLSRCGRPGNQVVHPRELSDALASYDRISAATAADMLHTWQVDPSYFLKRASANMASA